MARSTSSPASESRVAARPPAPSRSSLFTRLFTAALRTRRLRVARRRPPLGASPALLLAALLAAPLALGAPAGDAAGRASAAEPAETLEVLPRRIELPHRAARQTVVVERRSGDAYVGQAVDVEWTSSDQRVAVVVDGEVLPKGDGRAVLTARRGAAQATVEAIVSGQAAPFVWNFQNQVESVLSKTGCNGGACHGARAGKNGFRLSLFAYDPVADYSYLTRQANGRRMVPSDPGRSLLLTKPTGVLPHQGGVRFEPGSLEYQVLAEWIAAGAPGPRPDDPQIERLEVLPARWRQTPGTPQQLVVMAHFSDGRAEDVTRWAKYSSLHGSVAAVSDAGKVDVVGAGEGAVKVWYLNLNALAFVTSPYSQAVPPERFARFERRNFIDERVIEKLIELNVPPAPTADDATFLRRAFLDTIGVLPTPDEARKFLDDPAADKRDRMIDELLTRPEFVDYWSYKWSDLLLVSGERLRPAALEAYYRWIRERVARNTPWDEFVREVVTATGSTVENGAANFFALHQDPEDMAETTAQAFLGLSINCARCHNHPLEKWTNDQYYGLANLFSRVRSKGWGGDFRSGDGVRIVFSDVRGELLQPGKGRAQPPRPLDAPPLDFDATADRRLYLAEWLTAPDNSYFSRTIVNRIWANFFGTGLVEEVDDLRVTNPASNERLLNEAAGFLVAKRFDLKSLMREILRSSTYQRSSVADPLNAADERFYARCYPRRLKAEVLLDAVSQATGAASEFKSFDNKPFPPGTRAQQLPDAAVVSYFLKTFGRPERLITCDCERSDEPSMTQVLHLVNGETVVAKLKAAGNRIDRQFAAGDSDEAIVEQLYWAALVRPPTDAERSKLIEILREAPAAERRQAIEDVYWAVLSSREFLFNH